MYALLPRLASYFYLDKTVVQLPGEEALETQNGSERVANTRPLLPFHLRLLDEVGVPSYQLYSARCLMQASFISSRKQRFYAMRVGSNIIVN
ncbi:hypothetical protein RRG08_039741 [Elysia crispata]|uniref:Uncharacterized protein n=1 Tax=Elysia crispata TaxID=231223 RepID=A0AAE0YAH5_9GAST|nr:hypothetical protein RRG08_039741 [Elysia crispata]